MEKRKEGGKEERKERKGGRVRKGESMEEEGAEEQMEESRK